MKTISIDKVGQMNAFVANAVKAAVEHGTNSGEFILALQVVGQCEISRQIEFTNKLGIELTNLGIKY